MKLNLKMLLNLFPRLTNELASFANSYKAKEYLLAEVSENPLFLLNFIPLNEYD